MTDDPRVAGEGPVNVLVSRPRGSDAGALSVDMAACFAWARHERMAACLLRPPVVADEALFSLAPVAGVARVEPHGLRGAWWKARLRLQDVRRRAADGMSAGASSFWLETYRELRRHVSDQRLPYPLRARLRETSRGAFARSREVGRSEADPFPRRLLRRGVRMALPPDRMAHARARALGLGFSLDRPIVAVESPSNMERFQETIDALVGEGYQVVRLGVGEGTIDHPDVLDLTAAPRRDADLDVFLLLTCRFLVCAGTGAHQVAYLTNTPSLTIDVTDPIAAYPVREDGLHLLATAVDLETGATLTLPERLDESYLRGVHRFGHRVNTAAEILLAVREMKDGLERGWRESDAQQRYRTMVVDACAAWGRRLPHVAVWGTDHGFIGDGRLARVQADRWL